MARNLCDDTENRRRSVSAFIAVRGYRIREFISLKSEWGNGILSAADLE